MHNFSRRYGKPEMVEGSPLQIDFAPFDRAMQGEVVGAAAQVDVVGIGLPIDRHPHRLAVKRDCCDIVRIGNPECEMTQTERGRWCGGHGRSLAAGLANRPCRKITLSTTLTTRFVWLQPRIHAVFQRDTKLA